MKNPHPIRHSAVSRVFFPFLPGLGAVLALLLVSCSGSQASGQKKTDVFLLGYQGRVKSSSLYALSGAEKTLLEARAFDENAFLLSEESHPGAPGSIDGQKPPRFFGGITVRREFGYASPGLLGEVSLYEIPGNVFVGKETYLSDKRGLPIETLLRDSGDRALGSRHFEYDYKGNVVGIKYLDPSSKLLAYEKVQSYKSGIPSERSLSLPLADGSFVTVGHVKLDKEGSPESLSVRTGTAELKTEYREEKKYDSRGNWTESRRYKKTQDGAWVEDAHFIRELEYWP